MAPTKRPYDMLANTLNTSVKICDNVLGGVGLKPITREFLCRLLKNHKPKLKQITSKVDGVDILSHATFIIKECPSVVFKMQFLNESILERWEHVKIAARIFTAKKEELHHLVMPPQSLIRVDTSYLIAQKKLVLENAASQAMNYHQYADDLNLALTQLTKFIIWSGFRHASPGRTPVLYGVCPDQQRRIGVVSLEACGTGTLSSRFVHHEANKNKKYKFGRARKLTFAIAKNPRIDLVKEDLDESMKNTFEDAFKSLVKFVFPQHFDVIYAAALSERVDLKTVLPSRGAWEQACDDRLQVLQNGQLTKDLAETTRVCANINGRYFRFMEPLETLKTVPLKLEFDLNVAYRAFESTHANFAGVLFANKNSKVVSIIGYPVQDLESASAVLKSFLGEEGEVISSVKRLSPDEGLCLLVRPCYAEKLPDFVKIHRDSGFPLTTAQGFTVSRDVVAELVRQEHQNTQNTQNTQDAQNNQDAQCRPS